MMEDSAVEEYLNRLDELLGAEMEEDESSDEYNAGIIEGYRGGLRTAKDAFMEAFQVIEVDNE